MRSLLLILLTTAVLLLAAGMASAGVVDDGSYPFEYGYNVTTGTMTNFDGLSFHLSNNNGIVAVKRADNVVGHFGFAFTANNMQYIKTTEDFVWQWSHSTDADNHIFNATNNNGWEMSFYFYPDQPMKIVHRLTNNVQTVEDAKFWYIQTVRGEKTVIYNGTEYTLNRSPNIHKQGNFNDLMAKVELRGLYDFNYTDLVGNNFDITDIYLGDGGIIGHSGKTILAVGVTKNAGTFPLGASVTLDPTIEAVDEGGLVGESSSIALDSDGYAHISYYDSTNDRLKYCNNSLGSWSCETVETGGVVFEVTSIAIDSTDKIHVTHYNHTSNNLRCCNNTFGGWDCVTLDNTGVAWDYFTDLSIAIDSSDKIHISYQYGESEVQTDLKYCTNAGGAWACEVVDSDNDRGGHSSIAINSSDVVYISHYDWTSGDLRLCNGTAGAWTCEIVDSDDNVGLYSSIAIDSNDFIYISHYEYIDADNGNLRACNDSSGAWFCTDVETGAETGKFTSIAIDAGDFIHISYFNDTANTLRYCNNTGGAWACEEIASVGGDIKTFGRAMAIQEGRMSTSTTFSNNVHISYFNDSADDLYYARLDNYAYVAPYTPPDPTNLQNTTGTGWVNYTWQAGTGNVTDSYNVDVNGAWTNGSSTTFKYISLESLGWANITVWALNSSGSDTLSTGNVSDSIQGVVNTVTGVSLSVAGSDHIAWSWTNPTLLTTNMIYLDDMWRHNTSGEIWVATSLSESTVYTIKIITVYNNQSSNAVEDVQVTTAASTGGGPGGGGGAGTVIYADGEDVSTSVPGGGGGGTTFTTLLPEMKIAPDRIFTHAFSNGVATFSDSVVARITSDQAGTCRISEFDVNPVSTSLIGGKVYQYIEITVDNPDTRGTICFDAPAGVDSHMMKLSLYHLDNMMWDEYPAHMIGSQYCAEVPHFSFFAIGEIGLRSIIESMTELSFSPAKVSGLYFYKFFSKQEKPYTIKIKPNRELTAVSASDMLTCDITTDFFDNQLVICDFLVNTTERWSTYKYKGEISATDVDGYTAIVSVGIDAYNGEELSFPVFIAVVLIIAFLLYKRVERR